MRKIAQLFTFGTMLLFSMIPVAFAEVVIPGLACSQLDPTR